MQRDFYKESKVQMCDNPEVGHGQEMISALNSSSDHHLGGTLKRTS